MFSSPSSSSPTKKSSKKKQQKLIEKLRQREETFSEPIVLDGSRSSDYTQAMRYREFCNNFQVNQDETNQLLREHSCIAKHYQTLVLERKSVTAKDFWSRYYYRIRYETKTPRKRRTSGLKKLATAFRRLSSGDSLGSNNNNDRSMDFSFGDSDSITTADDSMAVRSLPGKQTTSERKIQSETTKIPQPVLQKYKSTGNINMAMDLSLFVAQQDESSFHSVMTPDLESTQRDSEEEECSSNGSSPMALKMSNTTSSNDTQDDAPNDVAMTLALKLSRSLALGQEDVMVRDDNTAAVFPRSNSNDEDLVEGPTLKGQVVDGDKEEEPQEKGDPQEEGPAGIDRAIKAKKAVVEEQAKAENALAKADEAVAEEQTKAEDVPEEQAKDENLLVKADEVVPEEQAKDESALVKADEAVVEEHTEDEVVPQTKDENIFAKADAAVPEEQSKEANVPAKMDEAVPKGQTHDENVPAKADEAVEQAKAENMPAKADEAENKVPTKDENLLADEVTEAEEEETPLEVVAIAPVDMSVDASDVSDNTFPASPLRTVTNDISMIMPEEEEEQDLPAAISATKDALVVVLESEKDDDSEHLAEVSRDVDALVDTDNTLLKIAHDTPGVNAANSSPKKEQEKEQGAVVLNAKSIEKGLTSVAPVVNGSHVGKVDISGADGSKKPPSMLPRVALVFLLFGVAGGACLAWPVQSDAVFAKVDSSLGTKLQPRLAGGRAAIIAKTTSVMDFTCAPVRPGLELEAETPVVAKAPWWAAESTKASAFGLLCGDRARTFFEWGMESDQQNQRRRNDNKKQKSILQVTDMDSGERMIGKAWSFSVKVESDAVWVQSKSKGDMEMLRAPWALNTN